MEKINKSLNSLATPARDVFLNAWRDDERMSASLFYNAPERWVGLAGGSSSIRSASIHVDDKGAMLLLGSSSFDMTIESAKRLSEAFDIEIEPR